MPAREVKCCQNPKIIVESTGMSIWAKCGNCGSVGPTIVITDPRLFGTCETVSDLAISDFADVIEKRDKPPATALHFESCGRLLDASNRAWLASQIGGTKGRGAGCIRDENEKRTAEWQARVELAAQATPPVFLHCPTAEQAQSLTEMFDAMGKAADRATGIPDGHYVDELIHELCELDRFSAEIPELHTTRVVEWSECLRVFEQIRRRMGTAPSSTATETESTSVANGLSQMRRGVHAVLAALKGMDVLASPSGSVHRKHDVDKIIERAEAVWGKLGA